MMQKEVRVVKKKKTMMGLKISLFFVIRMSQEMMDFLELSQFDLLKEGRVFKMPLKLRRVPMSRSNLQN
jgi:hypothetical protein